MFKLRRVYCATIGAEYMHISDPVEKIWFRERMEKNENQINFTNKGKKAILKTIITTLVMLLVMSLLYLRTNSSISIIFIFLIRIFLNNLLTSITNLFNKNELPF